MKREKRGGDIQAREKRGRKCTIAEEKGSGKRKRKRKREEE